MAAASCCSIVLDRTLKDLFMPDDDHQNIVLMYGTPPSTVSAGQPVSPSRKYVSLSQTLGGHGNLSRRMRSLVYPQHLGFIAGNMPLYLFKVDEGLFHPQNVQGLFVNLAIYQRPELRIVPDLTSISRFPDIQVAILHPRDEITHLPHLISPEAHYLLHSKRELAISNIPTPTTSVIDTLLQPDQVHDATLVDAEIARMTGVVLQEEIPFVLKFSQASGSLGTFVVHSEKDRQDFIEIIGRYLRGLLRQLHISNLHLHPSSLIIQKFISGEAVCVTFFIPKSGKPTFLGCTKQLLDRKGRWVGGSISYKEQDGLRVEYSPLIEKVAIYCQQKGYFGPCGVDVMTAKDGRHLVIDLNPRSNGGMPLCLLKNHFSRRRCLHEAACLVPLVLSCSQDEFEGAFRSQYQEGSLVITSWDHYTQENCSIAAIIIAAETRSKLKDYTEEIKKYEIAA